MGASGAKHASEEKIINPTEMRLIVVRTAEPTLQKAMKRDGVEMVLQDVVMGLHLVEEHGG